MKPGVGRVLVVDDSPSVRSLLSARLREQGFEVDEAPNGEAGVERAVASRPDLVVTDLVMKGLSGVQLCRILRADAATAHVPVVLLTASGNKRSRFWARSAGAALYVSKDKLDDLVDLLPTLLSEAPDPALTAAEAQALPRRTLNERMSAVLDGALFDSVVAGEVRGLAVCGSLPKLFEKLVDLLTELLDYRYLALAPQRPYAPILAHVHPVERDDVERELLSVATGGYSRQLSLTVDDRAMSGPGTANEMFDVAFAGETIGRLILGPTSRGFSREDKRILALVAGELSGSLQMSALYEDAQRMATTDSLTGLTNRRAFVEIVERERIRSDRHAFQFSLMMVDIDHFKAINDTRGHAAGDAVLKGVAAVLAAVARRTDLVARWGGEEFVIALPQTGSGGARIAAERVRRAIAEATHPVPGGEALGVTASVGVSSAEAPWTLEGLTLAADAAMYAAKARGRNRVEAHAPVPAAAPRSE